MPDVCSAVSYCYMDQTLPEERHHYLTRARSEPASDPVKPVIGKWLSGFVHAYMNILPFCHSAKSSMPIRISSQITVDCKSVHLF